MANLNKVNVGVEDRKKAEFDFSHTINTTNDFGHVQTLACEYIPLGDTKVSSKLSNFTRVSPLVAPTFGYFKNITYHHFVPVSDLFPHFNSLLAGKPVYLENQDYTGTLPKNSAVTLSKVPYISNCILSCLLLQYMTVAVYTPFYEVGPGGQSYVGHTKLSRSEFEGNYPSNYFRSMFNGLFNTVNTAFQNYLLNHWYYTYMESDHAVDTGIPVTADKGSNPFNAQFVFCVNRESSQHYVCFYHTRKSKTLLNHLLGCGFKPNFDYKSDYEVNILPLYAVAKAHFDIFSLIQYQNYFTSFLYRAVEYYTHNAPSGFLNFADFPAPQKEVDLFQELLDYLSDTTYTSEVDYLAAHQPLNRLAGTQESSLPSSPEWGDGTQDLTILNLPNTPNAANSRINKIDLQPSIDLSARGNWLTHLDIQLLQKMYLWVNRSSQVGYDIRNALLTRGYSQFVETCESYFLGVDTNTIEVDAVTSMSDTYDSANNSGAALGEIAGQSKGYKDGKNISFTAKEIGYYIVLNVIIPNNGYVGSLKPSLLGIDRYTLYNPDYDGFGYEFSPNAVCGANNQLYLSDQFGSASNTHDAESFGLIPRYTGFKISADIASGDMANFMFKDTFRPYFMERIITGKSVDGMVNGETPGGSTLFWIDSANSLLPYRNVPEAGVPWRKVFTSPYMNNLHRIFQNYDDSYANYSFNLPAEDFYLPLDNFISHNYLQMKIWSRMLPVMDTFQTEEVPGEGKHITVEK